jgi:uncharacterized membrane protein
MSNLTKPNVADTEAVERPAPSRLVASRAGLWAGAGLGALTFLAYLPGLGRSLDFDSAQTVGMFVKPGPPWEAFRLQAVFNNHPLFSFLEQLVRVVTGRTDAAAMRVLPILFGALAVGALTWFAARRHGLAAGLVAGGLLACNPTFVTLSRAVRGYSLLVLCAIVATILVAEDRPGRPGWRDLAYVAVTGMGLATHLYMFPVVAAHVGAVVARRQLDARWRMRFAGAAMVAAVAYAGMAASMVDTMGAYSRVLKVDLPWKVAVMATGGGRASLIVAPLVVAGAVLLLRRSRAGRGAAVALAGVLLVQWAGLQSSALTARFFVWLVPGAAYLAAVAVGRLRTGAVLAAVSAALAVSVVATGYTSDPTAYRQAAALVEAANATGARSCVVNVGVPPMLAYLDSPEQFAAVTDPAQLDACDLVLVTAWWPSQSDWYARDRAVIAEAERRFPYRWVLPHGDPTLVLSSRPPSPGGTG